MSNVDPCQPPAREVRWELHILPMFRMLDRDHMLFRARFPFDMYDYDTVVKKAQNIIDRLCSGSMPTTGTGGPWPKEWVDLFRRWVKEECRRLKLLSGTYKAKVQEVTLSDGSKRKDVFLTARVTPPADAGEVWFELLSTGSPREYALYTDPDYTINPDDPPMPPIDVIDSFPYRAGVDTYVVVHDKSGQPQQVPITV